jgi:uncharacterized protein with von Willebrand factor type A (vWA) domain
MSALLVPFLYALRKRQLRVGTTEVVTLARGLSLGLHGSTLEGFYYLARAVMVHRDGELDRFDQAFAHHFRGVEPGAEDLLGELRAALTDPAVLQALVRDQVEEGSDPSGAMLAELAELFGKPLTEGDAGAGEELASGQVGAEGRGALGRRGRGVAGRGAASSDRRGSSAVGMADARRYRRYRSDLVLDVRQIELALRRLRTLSRDGHPTELDLDGTVDRTARAFGDLEIQLRPPRKTNVRVLLLMDVGGSMEPFATVCSQLFSAAKRASNLRELRSYYFHNVPYGRVFSTDGQMTPIGLPELLDQVSPRWKLVVVGDASMAPGEMLSVGPWGSTWRRPDGGPMRGFDWLVSLADHFERAVWLNPDPPSYWVGGTVEIIKQVVPMHHLSLDGLTDAVSYLSREAVRKPLRFTGNPRNAL